MAASSGMPKRESTNSLDDIGSMTDAVQGATSTGLSNSSSVPEGLAGQSELNGTSEGINKKARYLSEEQSQPGFANEDVNGNEAISAGLYGGMSGLPASPLGVGQPPHGLQPLHIPPTASMLAGGVGPSMSPNYAPMNTGSGRTFSGANIMTNLSATIPGMATPATPFLAEQYAAMLSAGLPPSMATTPQGASFLGSMQNPLGPAASIFQPGGFGASPMALSPSAVGLPSPFLATHQMGMLAQAQPNATGRTVYVGNLPAEASVDELLSQVKFGPIENVRILPEKSCAFISFLDGNMAAAFHADASVKKMSLHNQELKIGWGKPSSCPPAILMAVQQNQATRNVYLGQLDDSTTEQTLRDDLSRFGPIDQVKIVRDKNIGFVHFLSIATAIKVVATLPTEPAWSGKRVNFGKDRCAYVPKSQQQNQAHNNQAAAMGMAAAASLGYPSGFNASALGGYGALSPVVTEESRSPTSALFGSMASPATMQQVGNRTVYLGNIHPDTTTEEICNHIRGGILQNVRYIPEKHIAFITFIESNAALAFHHMASFSGIMIHQRRLKVGWGKHSGPLSPAIAMAVQAGGSRNVYIGNIEDFDFHTVERLRADFGEYGETELVNTYREKNCAFVNFCNIQNAIKAIEAMKNHPSYVNQRIGAGKDRCGNPPRASNNGVARVASHGSQPSSAPGMASFGNTTDGLVSADQTSHSFESDQQSIVGLTPSTSANSRLADPTTMLGNPPASAPAEPTTTDL